MARTNIDPMLRGASRRSHPKSRKGCKTCKSRKIKVCNNMHKVDPLYSSFLFSPINIVDGNRADRWGFKCDETKPACKNCVKHNVECDFLGLNSPRTDLSPGPSQVLDMSSLELLHNFTTRTFATLSESLILRDFYRFSAVQRGLQCEYIMRTLLAISALHLAHHNVEMRDYYQSLGMAHHRVATRDASKENLKHRA